jgi:hypothetical protein
VSGWPALTPAHSPEERGRFTTPGFGFPRNASLQRVRAPADSQQSSSGLFVELPDFGGRLPLLGGEGRGEGGCSHSNAAWGLIGYSRGRRPAAPRRKTAGVGRLPGQFPGQFPRCLPLSAKAFRGTADVSLGCPPWRQRFACPCGRVAGLGRVYSCVGPSPCVFPRVPLLPDCPRLPGGGFPP